MSTRDYSKLEKLTRADRVRLRKTKLEELSKKDRELKSLLFSQAAVLTHQRRKQESEKVAEKTTQKLNSVELLKEVLPKLKSFIISARSLLDNSEKLIDRIILELEKGE